jgi:hypothetical protein
MRRAYVAMHGFASPDATERACHMTMCRASGDAAAASVRGDARFSWKVAAMADAARGLVPPLFAFSFSSRCNSLPLAASGKNSGV